MPYATYDQLVAKYGEEYVLLCFDRIAIGDADTEAVDANLADASALIDTYLTTRYSLPIVPVPDILVALCRDIAVYYGSPTADSLTDEKRKRFDDAVAWLKSVRDGLVDLGVPENTAPGDARAVTLLSTQPILFTRDTLRGVF